MWRRLEGQLLTASFLLDKTVIKQLQLESVWIVSLGLSKAFDRIRWPTLWVALREQGVPEHLVGFLANAYAEQSGEVLGEWPSDKNFLEKFLPAVGKVG